MGCAQHHGSFIVARHAHAEPGESVIAGQLGKKGEIGCSLETGRRNRHQPGQIEAGRLGFGDQQRKIIETASTLLRFVPDIDLDEAVRAPVGFLLGPRERSHERRTIDRVDDIEKRNRVVRLVLLKLSDKMEFNIGIFGAQRGPLGLRFLHPVFAEAPLPRGEQRADRGGILCLRHGDKLHFIGSPPRELRRASDIRLYFGQSGLCVFIHHPAIGRQMPQRHRQQLPSLWLMTDERMGDALLPSIERLPTGSGIIFRHYSLTPAARSVLLGRIRRIARARRLTVLSGGRRGEHGRHFGALTAPVHSLRERIAAERRGARLIFVSAVFPTASHPGARPLGRVRFGLLIRGSRIPVIALGGMTRKNARSLSGLGIYGWAAISGLMR